MLNKYLNMIVIAFFCMFSLEFEFGFSFIVPIVFIYILLNPKSIFIFLPVTVSCTYFFFNNMIVSVILMYTLIVIYLLLLYKKQSVLLCSIFAFIITTSMYVISSNMNNISFDTTITLFNGVNISSIYIIIIYSLISSFVLSIVYSILRQNKEAFIYFEGVVIFFAILCSSRISSDINVAFILGVFYAMYFSFNTGIYASLSFSVLLSVFMYYVYKIDYSLILPFVSIVYLINNIASGFITVILSTIVAFLFPEYINICMIVGVECILFEVVKNRNISKKVVKKDVYIEEYNNGLEVLNRDIIGFSSFLDMCASDTNNTKEYHKRLNEGINNLISNYCTKCYVRGKCDQTHIKEHMKELIYNAKDNTYSINDNPVLSVCPFNVEMRKSAIITYDSLNNINVKRKEKAITAVLNGVSNMLRQFVVETNSKKELDYEKIYKIKKSLVDSGYLVTLFKCKKLFVDDFVIEVGIRGNSYEDICENIETICNKHIKTGVTLEYDRIENNKVYFRIIPRVLCKIEYGKTNIASGTVSGDNVLVRETDDGKIVSVICDGMGKGYSASLSSEAVVQMIDELYNSSMSSYAIVQIINTYCGIKDSIDSFCTLDYLELNRKNNELTFYKMSSAPTYIFHKDKSVVKVNNKRLPLGKESEIIVENEKIDTGDIIVMSSDGVFDNIVNEKELENMIQSITHLSVEKIVCRILEYIEHEKMLTNDDLSIVVLKVLPL